MQFDEYMEAAASTAIYPDANTGSAAALAYVSLGLGGECSEVVEKALAGDNAGLAKELGDVAWYLARMHSELGLSWPVWSEPVNWVTPNLDVVSAVCGQVVVAGRVQEVIKKLMRDDDGSMTSERRALLEDRLTALVGAWLKVHASYGLDPHDTVAANAAKLASRKDRGVLQGSGDNR